MLQWHKDDVLQQLLSFQLRIRLLLPSQTSFGGCQNAVYPTACCVSALAAFGEAGCILTHHGLLQAMVFQAVAEIRTAQGLVGTALARAVLDAMHCCAGSLTTAAVRELKEVLANAMNDEVLRTNVVAHTHLEQAWLETKLLAA